MMLYNFIIVVHKPYIAWKIPYATGVYIYIYYELVGGFTQPKDRKDMEGIGGSSNHFFQFLWLTEKLCLVTTDILPR